MSVKTRDSRLCPRKDLRLYMRYIMHIHVRFAALLTVVAKYHQPRYISANDKENMWSVHSRVLFSHKEKWNYIICRKRDVAGTEWKVGCKRQMSQFFSYGEGRVFVVFAGGGGGVFFFNLKVDREVYERGKGTRRKKGDKIKKWRWAIWWGWLWT